MEEFALNFFYPFSLPFQALRGDTNQQWLDIDRISSIATDADS